jgi:arylsulfatase A-like enzyme
VGLYGYPRPTTPALDRWSRRAVVFRDAVSVSAWTLPAHLSILTSVAPSRHGGVDGHHGFNRSVPTLAQTLRRAGFTTHAITSQLYVSPAYGLDAGFDTFDYAEPRGAEEVAARAIAALDAHHGRPFFLFLHFYDVHWPYDAPKEARRPFGARPASEIGSRPPAETRPADPRPLLDAYDAEIRHVDRHLGRVLEHLDKTGWSDHTLVAITSDHGEEFGEHGGYEHLRTLYEEVIRIPMLVRAPRTSARDVSDQVGHLDLAPTVLAAVGLPPEPSHEGRDLLGTLEPREAFGETELGRDPGGPKVRRGFLRGGAGKSKLIVDSDRRTGSLLAEGWFDLARDPGERASLAPPAAAARGWRARLAARQVRGPSGLPATVTEDDKARLAALGYLGR